MEDQTQTRLTFGNEPIIQTKTSVSLESEPEARIILPAQNPVNFYNRLFTAGEIIEIGDEGPTKRQLKTKDLLTEEGKLTSLGKEFSKFIYASINFGSWVSVSDRISQLKHEKTRLKEEGNDRESLLLHRIISSAEMQVRNNVINGIKQEILQERTASKEGKSLGWLDAMQMVGRVKGVNGPKDVKLENSTAAKIYGARNEVVLRLNWKFEKEKEHPLASLGIEEKLDLLRVVEREMIKDFIENGEGVESGPNLVSKIYGVSSDGSVDLEKIEEKMIKVRERLINVEEDISLEDIGRLTGTDLESMDVVEIAKSDTSKALGVDKPPPSVSES